MTKNEWMFDHSSIQNLTLKIYKDDVLQYTVCNCKSHMYVLRRADLNNLKWLNTYLYEYLYGDWNTARYNEKTNAYLNTYSDFSEWIVR